MSKRMERSTARFLSVGLILALLILVSGFASAQPRTVTTYFVQEAKLTAADGAAHEEFGNSVSVSGDTAVAGALFGDTYWEGTAYIFYRDLGGSNAWGQAAKLTAVDGAPDDSFGISVSVSDDTAAVGAGRDDIADSADQGSAYIFDRNEGGPDAWGQVAKVIAADGAANDYFGESVSISGDTVLVGAYLADFDGNSNQGAAYVFYRDQGGPDTWGQVAKLTAADGAAGDLFGYSVSVSGDTAVVGAGDADIGGNDAQGAAYIFHRDQGGPNAWGQVAKLTAADGAAYDLFGISVSVSGDTAVVGALQADTGDNGNQGAAYIFCRDQNGVDAWGQTARLTASDGAPSDLFGRSVSVSGDTAVVGARWDDDNGDRSGSAYLFEKPEAGWSDMTETAKLTASDGAEGDEFGSSVSIGGETIIAGVPKADVNDYEDQGTAYIFAPFEPVAWVYLPLVLRSAP